MTTHFTSDPHFGHAKVAGFRGFETAIEMDAAISDRWREAVAPDDVVWVLGDLAASSPTYALQRLAGLPGRKRLIWGNHDRGHPMHSDAHKWTDPYLDVFESMAQSARVRIRGREVLLSHFPYERDRDPASPRYLQWRLRDEGLPLLHGHTHGTERLTSTRVYDPNGWGAYRVRLEVHVGMDAWDLTPVSVLDVAALLEGAK